MWESFFSVALGVGSLIMGIVFSAMKQREKCNYVVRWTMLLVALLVGIMALFYGLYHHNIVDINTLLIVTLVVLFLVGGSIVLINVSSMTAMMKIIDKDKLGKVTGVSSIGSQGLIPLSMLLGGVAITYIGSLGLLITCAAGLLITSLVLFFIPSVRNI